MHQGHHAAVNIHQTMLSQSFGSTPKFVEIQKPPPMLCVAIGRNAVGYNPMEGVISGEDTRKLYFKDDLGFESMIIQPHKLPHALTNAYDTCIQYAGIIYISEPQPQGDLLES